MPPVDTTPLRELRKTLGLELERRWDLILAAPSLDEVEVRALLRLGIPDHLRYILFIYVYYELMYSASRLIPSLLYDLTSFLRPLARASIWNKLVDRRLGLVRKVLVR